MSRRPIVLLAALLMSGMLATPDAIGQGTSIEGRAVAKEGGAPVEFAVSQNL